MKLHEDIFEKVGALLKKHSLDQPDPEKTKGAEVSVFMAGFHEIEEFVKANGRLPQKGKSISERKLASRLKGIVEDDEKRTYLEAHDSEGIIVRYCEEHGFVAPTTLESRDDIAYAPEELKVAEDSSIDSYNKPKIPDELKGIAGSKSFANLMGGGNQERSLFGGRFAKKAKKEQVMPDYVAKRKTCPDFDKFSPFFERCLADLKTGARKAIPFKNEQHIEKGKFYVLGGLLCYVADKGKSYMHKGKRNTRLRLIFTNERESDMLLRSLSTELYKGGLMITENEAELFEHMKINPDDQETGWIYVLKSLSDDTQVTSVPDLHKIGFTTTSVEKRIAGAEKQVTYLMAPVEVVATAKTANLSTHALEQIIHAVFGQARLDIEVTDQNGKVKKATEWFTAPWAAIEHAIQLIANNQIEHYCYNPEIQELEFRK